MALTIDRVTTNVSTNADGEVVGDGVFDTLMETVTKHVNAQFESNHITGEEYANVYLGLVQTAMAQSMDFVKNQDLLDAQLVKANAEAEAAETAADNIHVKTLAEVDKIYGFSYTLDANGDIDRSSLVDTADGKLDYENLNIVAQTALTTANITLTTEKVETENLNNKVDGVVETQIAKLLADTDAIVASTSLTSAKEVTEAKQPARVDAEVASILTATALTDEKIASELLNNKADGLIESQITGIKKDNEVKAETALMAAYERTTLQPEQLLKVQADTALTTENITLTAEKIESENKNNMADGVLDAQISKVKADADIAYQKSLVEKANSEATTVKVLGYSYEFDANGDFIGVDTGAGKLDYETNLMAEQLDSERIGQKAKIAQVRDEFGREIDETNDSVSSEVGLKHTHTLAILEEDALRKSEETAIAKAKVFEADTDHWIKKYKAKREEGVTFINAYNDLLSNSSSISVDSISSTSVPLSRWESDMRRSDKEIAVADASEKGYKADSYYKQYKSLQELMFSLTNSQIIEEAGGTVYESLVTGIELNMNKQSLVWDAADTTLVNIHAGGDLALTQAVTAE